MNHHQDMIMEKIAKMPDEFVEMSRRNCHAIGVDSIVIGRDQDTGGLNRMFIAWPGCELESNTLGNQFTVGIHDHKYPIDIYCVCGMVANITYGIYHRAPMKLNGYRFTHEMDGRPVAQHAGQYGVVQIGYDMLGPIGHDGAAGCCLPASELHTMMTFRGTNGAAWEVIEGARTRDETLLLSHIASPEYLIQDDFYQPFGSRGEIENVARKFFNMPRPGE